MIPDEVTDAITEVEEYMEKELKREPNHVEISKIVIFNHLRKKKPECSTIKTFIKYHSGELDDEYQHFLFLQRVSLKKLCDEFK